MPDPAVDKLHYVRIPGGHGARAEGVRLAYVIAGRPWTDVLYSFAEVRTAAAGKTPFNQMPFVETASGEIIYQSLAIMQHAGQGTRAWPSDPHKLTLALEVGLAGYDLYQWFGGFAADDLPAKKRFEERRAPQFFGGLGKIYGERAFAAGDEPSFADAYTYEATGWCARRNDVCRDLLAGNEALRAFRSRFEAIPEVGAFLERQRAARAVDDSV